MTTTNIITSPVGVIPTGTGEVVYEYQTKEEFKALSFLVQSLYQIQKLRIGLGNRIYAHCITNLGIAPGTKVKDQAMAAKLLKQLEAEYKDITTALANSIFSEELRMQLKKKKVDVDTFVVDHPELIGSTQKKVDDAIKEVEETLKQEYEEDNDLTQLIRKFNKTLINNSAEFAMARIWITLHNLEHDITQELGHIINKFDMWNYFLANVRGIGPTLAACLISTINLYKCPSVQSLWKYCGLDVVHDENDPDAPGVGRSHNKEHMHLVTYINKKGEQCQKMSLTYNPWIKTKLMGVAAGMLMHYNKEYYAIYSDIRKRLENSDRVDRMRPKVEKGKPVLDKDGKPIMLPEYPLSRINMMSLRYMIKMFLMDYWVHGRCLIGEKLEVPYAQKKLGYQCKFRTFVGGKFVRVAYYPDMDLDVLRAIQNSPIEKVAV